MRSQLTTALAALLLAAGCTASDGPVADAGREAGATPDAAPADSGASADTLTVTPDARVWPDAPATGIDTATIVKVCTIVGACIGSEGANACIRDYYAQGRGAASMFSCIAKAKGCAGLRTCVGFYSYKGKPCDTGPKGTQCIDGTAEAICLGGGRGVRIDCGLYYSGATCKAGTGGGGCSTGKTCTGTAATCVKGHVVRCKFGIEHFEDNCAFKGWACKQGDCRGPQEACTTSRCEGTDVLAYCKSGFIRRVRCSSIERNFLCTTRASGTPRCERGNTCDVATLVGKETCNGDKLVVCNGGKREEVDCKALGFSSCSATAHGCTL